MAPPPYQSVQAVSEGGERGVDGLRSDALCFPSFVVYLVGSDVDCDIVRMSAGKDCSIGKTCIA